MLYTEGMWDLMFSGEQSHRGRFMEFDSRFQIFLDVFRSRVVRLRPKIRETRRRPEKSRWRQLYLYLVDGSWSFLYFPAAATDFSLAMVQFLLMEYFHSPLELKIGANLGRGLMLWICRWYCHHWWWARKGL